MLKLLITAENRNRYIIMISNFLDFPDNLREMIVIFFFKFITTVIYTCVNIRFLFMLNINHLN